MPKSSIAPRPTPMLWSRPRTRRAPQVGDDLALGDLELERLGRQVAARQEDAHQLGEVVVEEVRAERFTDICTCSPARRQAAHWRTAESMTHSVRLPISPCARPAE